MTQLFKTQIPSEILFKLFTNLSVKQSNYFIFDLISFKKGIFTEEIVLFLETIKPYYYLSKQKYVSRLPTYNTFTTIIRQICNYNKIKYKTEIKYDKSTYNIVYHIYHDTTINI